MSGVATESFPVSRRSERVPTQIAIILIVETEGERLENETSTVDFSQHGVRIQVSSSGLTPGQIVEVIPTQDPSYSVRSRVVWVGPTGSDQKDQAGLEFLSPLPGPN
ncbi:MAG: hypothetical protein DMG23_03930 [Acidobacteria bacterium]|nr:MAG: hypothetical protein DMG23_03930 [Acidobacteriota bacterium]